MLVTTHLADINFMPLCGAERPAEDEVLRVVPFSGAVDCKSCKRLMEE